MHNQGVPLALTTSSGRTGTSHILKKAGLLNTFDVIVTSEDYTNRKPSPESYLTTAKKLHYNPVNCVAIEDSRVGVEAAKNAGMKCIALPNEYTKHQDFSKADLVVYSADNINIELLNNLSCEPT